MSNMMNERGRDSPREPEARDRGAERGPPTSAVLIVLALIATACIAGYFLLMKLISISRDEDCILAHRKDCAAIEVPTNQ